MSNTRTPESILRQKISRAHYEIRRAQQDHQDDVARRYARLADLERELSEMQHPSNSGGAL